MVAAGIFLLSAAGLLITFFQLPQGSERARRRSRRLAYATIIVSLIVSAGALTSLFTYGPASDARAAIAWRAGTLRSIPTEADTTQKTTPLAAGSLAAVDQKFLGWRHLTFPSGQTGWVRAEDLVPLWR
jgi:hypothetical protein